LKPGESGGQQRSRIVRQELHAKVTLAGQPLHAARWDYANDARYFYAVSGYSETLDNVFSQASRRKVIGRQTALRRPVVHPVLVVLASRIRSSCKKTS
jgi:hypothetical protein